VIDDDKVVVLAGKQKGKACMAFDRSSAIRPHLFARGQWSIAEFAMLRPCKAALPGVWGDRLAQNGCSMTQVGDD
jgi:hypothetical protein